MYIIFIEIHKKEQLVTASRSALGYEGKLEIVFILLTTLRIVKHQGFMSEESSLRISFLSFSDRRLLPQKYGGVKRQF